MLNERNQGVTLICPAEPYSSVSLDLLKLQRCLCSSDRWNRMASVPFEQDMIWDMRWIQCHEEWLAGRFDILEVPNKEYDVYRSEFTVEKAY